MKYKREVQVKASTSFISDVGLNKILRIEILVLLIERLIHMKPKKIVFGLIFVFITIFLSAQTEDNTQDIISKHIQHFMKECSERGLFNGSVLVSKDSRIIYREALGYADILNRIPLSTESKFDIGSLTKSFTALGIMILEERGKLAYNDKLSSFFPEFPDYADNITIHHLLCHQSGIKDYHNDLAMFGEEITTELIMKRLIEEKLMFDPGTLSRYSNSGYFLLGRIIEKSSDLSFSEFIQKNIFNPLKMNNSIVYDNKGMNIESKSIGLNFKTLNENISFITGAGGIYTTTDDLYKWHQALCETDIVSKETIDRALTPSLLSNGYQTREGYGWHINYSDDVKIIEHGGASPAGYISYFWHPTSCNYSIVLLTNYFMSENFGIVLNGLKAIINGSNPKELRTPVMYKLNKYIIENGIKNLKTVFEEYNSDTIKYTPFDELNFIQLSSFYKNNSQYETAIVLLKIYNEKFPNSLIPLEELIEIYKISGTRKLLKNTENDLKKLTIELSTKEKVVIQLKNPKTKDYEMALRVRKGPGSTFDAISAIQPGESYAVHGRSLNGEWLKLKREGWVYYRKGRITEAQFKSLPFMRYGGQ